MINSACSKNVLKDEILNYFQNGAKSSSSVGIEYEKIGILSSNLAIPYGAVENLLEKLSEFENYKRILTDENNLIGLSNETTAISLEPGSQFEFSVAPQNDLKTLEKILKEHNKLVSLIAKDLGITWLTVGLQPVSVFENIKIIPKKRYEIMTDYLPNVAQLPLVMMRETAGIQVCVDYSSQEDAIDKLRLSLKLAPVISAVYSNSPVRNGKLSGYKSFRAYAWTNTDEERCGFISKNIFDKDYSYSFDDYIKDVCKVPMIMADVEGKPTPVTDFTFNDFIKYGFSNKFPELNDFLSHLSLTFFETRLKQYLEIRNHDSQKEELLMSVPAFWKSVMYDKDVFNDISQLLDKFEYDDFAQLRLDAPVYGLDTKINRFSLKDIAKEIFDIVYRSLNKTNEQHYIEPIYELVKDGVTPADIIIRNFNGIWNGDINKFIEYAKL